MIMPTPKGPATEGCLSFIMGAAAGIQALIYMLSGNMGIATWALATAYLCLRQGWNERDLAALRQAVRRNP